MSGSRRRVLEPDESARRYAAALRPGDAVRWRALEVQAFTPYPKVQKLLDPAMKYRSPSRHAGWRRAGAWVAFPLAALGLLTAIVFVFPVAAGLATLLGGRFGNVPTDPFVTLPIAGGIFAYQLVILIVSFVLWARSGRGTSGFRETQTGAATIFGVPSIIVAAIRGAEAEVPFWPLWTLLIVVSTTFALIFLVLLLRARGRRSVSDAHSDGRAANGTAASGKAVEPLRVVRLAVERLPPEGREAVRTDLTAAIDDLAARGLISDRDADWARGADLGKLALRMSQSRTKKTPDAR